MGSTPSLSTLPDEENNHVAFYQIDNIIIKIIQNPEVFDMCFSSK